MRTIEQDIDMLKKNYRNIPVIWDGKNCILELKDADFQWRQMEWIGFYFEFVSKKLLNNDFDFPGEKFGNVTFDLKGAINWDLKAKAIKSDNHSCILNDKNAMDESIKKYGSHGEIIALCDVEYNDTFRSFQNWHTELKGGKSNYEKEREQRTAVSRFRKTKAVVTEILFLIIRENDVENLSINHQGRNSNGSLRNVKYMLDLENIEEIEYHKISFQEE
jgi:hypothetical protein